PAACSSLHLGPTRQGDGRAVECGPSPQREPSHPGGRMSTVKDAISQAVDRLANELHALSTKIHDNPELAYQEVKACARLTEFLGKQGFKVEPGVGGVD